MVSAEPNAPQTKKATSATGRKPRSPSKAPPKKTVKPEMTAAQPTKTKKMAHPTYLAMITEAIRNLKKHNGASLSAIRSYIMKQFNVGVTGTATMNASIRQAIKRGLTSDQFVQVKGVGANGSFRLGDAAKKEAKKAAKKSSKVAPEAEHPKPKKAPAAKKVTEGPKRKAVAKMVLAAAEKTSAAKAPAKKKTVPATKTKTAATKMPKSPKSPAKMKKTAATKMPKAPKVKSAKASPMKKMSAKA